MALVIFTDLDGTLLDSAYSFQAALPALGQVLRASVPCVICSGKTAVEIEYYRNMLQNRDPFSCENGGAVFVPKGYFGPSEADPAATETLYDIIRLGAPYATLREAVGALRAKGYALTGFGDMSVEEVAALTGLPLDQAAMAKAREFDEPFVMEGDNHDKAEVVRAAREMGLAVSQGSLLSHLTGGNDKGKAVAIIAGLFKKANGSGLTFAALGNSSADLSMLEAVDVPIIVQRPDGTYDPHLQGKGFIEAGGSGPAGWTSAVLRLLQG
jgi:mannosyl-3-phosphoglycerate phosphatase